jgi:hypothetical protein
MIDDNENAVSLFMWEKTIVYIEQFTNDHKLVRSAGRVGK